MSAKRIILLFVIVMLCFLTGTSSYAEDVYMRVIRSTPVYLEPTEDEMFLAGYFLTESNVRVNAHLDNGWVEAEYYCDPGLLSDADNLLQSGTRTVYIQDKDLLPILNADSGIKNLIVQEETMQSLYKRSSFMPELLLSMQYDSSAAAGENEGLSFTVRNRTVGSDADARDVLAIQTRQPYKGNNRYIYIPEIKINGELQYPVNALSYNLPDTPYVDYNTSNELFNNPKVLAGLRFILENSPPYKVYTGYTTDYYNASRYAAALAIHDYLAETAQADDKYDIYNGVESYRTDEFSADYFGYACWLYESAIEIYAGYEENESYYISCDIQEAPVIKDGLFSASVRITTNSMSGWKILKSTLPEDVLRIENAVETTDAYLGSEGSTVIQIVSTKAVIGNTISIPVLFNTDEPIVQFKEPENTDKYPALVSLSKQDAAKAPKQVQITYPFASRVTITVTEEETQQPIDRISIRLKGENGNNYVSETINGEVVFDCVPDMYSYSVYSLSKEYEPIASGNIDAREDVSLHLSTSIKKFNVSLRIANSYTGETVALPCIIEVCEDNEEHTLIYNGSITDGELTLENLSSGNYVVKQITEFKGYEPAQDVVFKIEDNDMQVDIPNDPISGYIAGIVTTSGSDKPVSGVVVEITRKGKVVRTCTTDTDGSFNSGKVPTGEYEAIIRYLPNGYKMKSEAAATQRCKVSYQKTANLKWVVKSLEIALTVYPRESDQISNYTSTKFNETGICEIASCTYQLVAGDENELYEKGAIVAEFPAIDSRDKKTSLVFNHTGNYILREVNHGTGYEPSEDIEILITDSNKKYDIPVLKVPGSRTLNITKLDDAGLPESGTEIQIFRSEYEDYNSANEKSRIETVTDTEGHATINLLYGDWCLTVAGNTSSKTTLQIDKETPESLSIILNGTDKAHFIEIVVESEDGKVIEELSEFDLFHDGEIIETVSLNGRKKISQSLPHGDYTLRQTVSGGEYLASQDISFEITETDPEEKQVRILNPYKDKCLSVSVIAEENGKTTFVEGVRVIIKESLFDNPVLRMVSSRNGALITTPMPLKTYMVMVSDIPEGYTVKENPISVDLRKSDESIVSIPIVLIPNPTIISFRAHSTPESGQNGPIYGLYALEGENAALTAESAREGFREAKTARDGALLFAGNYTYGKYAIALIEGTEKTPVISSATYFEIGKEKRLIHVQKTEVKEYPVVVHAISVESEAPLENAYIRILNQNTVCFEGYMPEGEQALSLKPGIYNIRCVLAPEKYALPEGEITFVIGEDGSVSGVTEIAFEMNDVSVFIEDLNGDPVPNTEFVITNKITKQSRYVLSDEDGKVSFRGLNYGSYEIKEFLPAPGYMSNRSVIRVRLDGLYKNKAEKTVLKTDINKLYFKSVSTSGEPLENTELILMNSHGSILQSVLTSKDGIACFTAVPFGVYKVRMVKAPESYLKSNTEYDLVIGNNDDSVFARMSSFVCIPKTASFVLVNKKGHGVPGAKFELIDKNTAETIETEQTDVMGRFQFTAFDYGEYLIRQTYAPKGTAKIDDFEMTVNQKWRPREETLKTSYDYYEFNVIDNHGTPAELVQFVIRNIDTDDTDTSISNKDGLVRFEGLRLGNYEIRVKKTPDGLESSDEIISLQIDDSYEPPEALYMFVLKKKTI